ncbi:MAG TPA: aminotransferase class V-fold PLP-dependent enzyme [Vicinamibacterales bacterium]|nr:aminotransferase class V-fold PLP-dependent enzyme [Vicinamibacterales bacterium]
MQKTFSHKYPAYESTRALDALRAREYPLLDGLGQVYLDYTAGNLVPLGLLERHMQLLRDHLLGNPHSRNPTSALATTFTEQSRLSVLEFFNADPDEFAVIFTANATQALKLVGEAYPFQPSGEYLLTFDNHNSVNGIREFARANGCPTTYVPIVLPDMRVDDAELQWHLERSGSGGKRLFAYPAQSNFSGVQHPLEWIPIAQEHGWHVLLDAAAFTPTNRLDLGRWKPDFVSQSFYKMFGYPTGVGCLIARKSALATLHRPWFAGGTVTVASVQGDRFYLAEGASAFEDGTPNYLALPAVEFGLQYLSEIGIDAIHSRVRCLTGWLIERLGALRHAGGAPLARIYGPRTDVRRGGTITFNLYDRHNRAIDHRDVEQRAIAAGISLRTGCFCNPGGGEIALGITGTELTSCFHQPEHETRLTIEDFRLCIDGKSTGAVRVSLGLASNVADVEAFVSFAETFLK